MRPGATVAARDLRQRARSHIAGHKPPKAIHIMETLPLNATEKADKRQLQRMDGAPLVAV